MRGCWITGEGGANGDGAGANGDGAGANGEGGANGDGAGANGDGETRKNGQVMHVTPVHDDSGAVEYLRVGLDFGIADGS